MSAHNFNDTQVAKVVGKHLKNKRSIFQWTFAVWSLWESGPQVFVCAKSNLNLVLLIDVAFYFKCLWKYPTTVLCGPVPNETHSCTPLLAIRSVAKTQCSPWSVVSEWASTWWAWHRTIGCSCSSGDWHICERGFHDSAGQLCWCCQPHPPPLHLLWATWAPMEGFRRISTPEEGIKGSGASVQGSAWGFTFDLPSSTN